MADYWRRCSTCKLQLDYNQNYWVCNVSTCNRKRTGLVFCSVSCWDAHNPMMNHRESWAEERTAPSKEAWQRELEGEKKAAGVTKTATVSSGATSSSSGSGSANLAQNPARRVVARPQAMTMGQGSQTPKRSNQEVEVLVVVSKVKAFVKEIADMNTSASALQALTHLVRDACREASDKARADGRKTIMDRDFE